MTLYFLHGCCGHNANLGLNIDIDDTHIVFSAPFFPISQNRENLNGAFLKVIRFAITRK